MFGGEKVIRVKAETIPVIDREAAGAPLPAGTVARQLAHNQLTAALDDTEFINRVFSAMELVGVTDELANLERVEAARLMALADRRVAASMVGEVPVDLFDALGDTSLGMESRA